MKKALVIISLFVTLLFLTSCAQAQRIVCPDGTPMNFDSGELTPVTGGAVVNESIITNPSDNNAVNPSPIIQQQTDSQQQPYTFKEGDIVQINPNVTDPDGDELTINFGSPLNSSGGWKTSIGDAGNYAVLITVSDGINVVNKTINIIIIPSNRPPVLTAPESITVREGEVVRLDVTATDPEGSRVSMTYSGWMTANTQNTDYDDAGIYTVVVTASDGALSTVKNVTINVVNTNRPPVIGALQEITATEGEKVLVAPKFDDPDGDNVTITFSKPLGPDGSWETKSGDAGIYNVEVTVSDGVLSNTASLIITVKKKNNPPVIEVSDIVVDEGETVIINPVVTDPENDSVSLIYSGWMNTSTKTTGYDDAGTYEVVINGSDGQNSVVKKLAVVVKNKNRPPVFTI